MTTALIPGAQPEVVYPETDGAPIAENTLQFEWIDKVKGGLDDLFADRPDVFVAADLYWYPVEGHPEIVAAPDAMVAFGRPKGHRPSYMQWREGGVAPQVAFEVMSHANWPGEMARKLEFYRRHGVEEYYVIDPNPDRLGLTGYLRRGDALATVGPMHGHVSPRLGVRFEHDAAGLRLVRPDGGPFLTYGEVAARERESGLRAEQERLRADQALREVEQLREQLRAMGQRPT
jgi:hypothetical protein